MNYKPSTSLNRFEDWIFDSGSLRMLDITIFITLITSYFVLTDTYFTILLSLNNREIDNSIAVIFHNII